MTPNNVHILLSFFFLSAHAALCRWRIRAILRMDSAREVGRDWGWVHNHSRHCHGVSFQ